MATMVKELYRGGSAWLQFAFDLDWLPHSRALATIAHGSVQLSICIVIQE